MGDNHLRRSNHDGILFGLCNLSAAAVQVVICAVRRRVLCVVDRDNNGGIEMSNPYAMRPIERELQKTYCTRQDLDILGAEIERGRWCSDLLDNVGDPCGRMRRDLDGWHCQLNIHFGSDKYHSGPMACGYGSTPQEAYTAACLRLESSGYRKQAAYFRGINHE